MAYGKGRRRAFVFGYCAQRGLSPITGRYVDILERIGILGKARIHFHNDVILVQSDIHRRHLPLPEGIVQNVVDRLLSHTKPRGRLAVEGEVELTAAALLIAVDIGKRWKSLQLVVEFRRPFNQPGKIVALKSVLVLRVGCPSSDTNILDSLQIQSRSRDVRQVAAQPADDLVDAFLAPADILQ